MKSAGNGGVFKGSLQMLHVHVLLVAPLDTSHMAQPGTDQHQRRVAIRKTTHHTGAAAELPVQPLNDIIGADASPVLAGKIAVGQGFLNPILHLDCRQNGHIFKFSAPVAAQVDPIHIDIRIASALQRAVPPILDADIRFLVQLTDGGGRDLAAPQGLCDVLHTPDGYTCQVHLNEGLFHAVLPAAVSLNDGSFKGNSLELPLDYFLI